MSYLTDKFVSFCKFIGIDYLSKKSWKENNIDETNLLDVSSIYNSSDLSISIIAYGSLIMNAVCINELRQATSGSNSNIRKLALGLLVGNTCYYSYKLLMSQYNKIRAIDKIKQIMQDQGPHLGIPPMELSPTQFPVSPFVHDKTITYAQFTITPAQSMYVNGDDGMDDNIDDNSYNLNDTTHPIFNIATHGFEPQLLYRLHLKHPSEWIDSPPFKTSEEALQFAQYIDELVDSDDIFDYIKYMYTNDIRDIYHEYNLEDAAPEENNVALEETPNNEVESVEI